MPLCPLLWLGALLSVTVLPSHPPPTGSPGRSSNLCHPHSSRFTSEHDPTAATRPGAPSLPPCLPPFFIQICRPPHLHISFSSVSPSAASCWFPRHDPSAPRSSLLTSKYVESSHCLEAVLLQTASCPPVVRVRSRIILMPCHVCVAAARIENSPPPGCSPFCS